MASVPKQQRQIELYREPVTTPGLVPVHLKRATVDANPLIEVIQRLSNHIKPGSGATVEKLIALVALYKVVSPVWRHTKELLLQSLTSRISISEFDPLGQDILQWVAAEVVNRSFSTSAAVVTGDLGQRGVEMYGYYPTGLRVQSKQHSEEVHCLPPVGTKIFWVGFRPFLLARTGNMSSSKQHTTRPLLSYQGTPSNSIILFTPGWNLHPLMNFVKKCHDYKIANKTGTTNIYFSNGKGDPYSGHLWSSVIKAKRRLDTIDMDDTSKAKLVNDAEYYYSEESKKFFADCGIPYRRGYLFYGPPGTGKTSFSAALAGHLSCDLYLIDLATGDISDGQLHRLFLALPRKCIVVIEDIDSCGIGREQGPASSVPRHPGSPSAMTSGVTTRVQNGVGSYRQPAAAPRKRNMVTLSGLLNVIDGNASAEGRLLIMTSNNPDVLDEALTRPGRIDMKICFGKMMTKAIYDIFKRLIGRAAIATMGYTEEQIEEYATVFSARVPPDTFTPAQVQNFLQNCRGNPVEAIQRVDAWIEMTQDQAPEEALKGSTPLVPPPAVTETSLQKSAGALLGDLLEHSVPS